MTLTREDLIDAHLEMEPGVEHWGVPFWVRCHCLDWWCKVHEMHVHECACPHVEDLLDPDGPDILVVIQ